MSTEPAATSAEAIVKTPGTCGGRARIRGHRITVKHVVIEHHHHGGTPAEIAASYPSITLADVHAALAYYRDHREEIDADIADEERLVGELESNPSPLASRLKERARAARATANEAARIGMGS